MSSVGRITLAEFHKVSKCEVKGHEKILKEWTANSGGIGQGRGKSLSPKHQTMGLLGFSHFWLWGFLDA